MKADQVVDVEAKRSRARARVALAGLLVASLGLSACGTGSFLGSIREVGTRSQPDEFLILPTRPLEMPPSLADLPPPTPGAVNRVDYRPQQEAIAALTGRPPAQAPQAPGLVARVGAADPAIRSVLAQEDAAFREANRPPLLERWFRRDRARIPYESVTLDADAEWARLRAAGARVPAAPPR